MPATSLQFKFLRRADHARGGKAFNTPCCMAQMPLKTATCSLPANSVNRMTLKNQNIGAQTRAVRVCVSRPSFDSFRSIQHHRRARISAAADMAEPATADGMPVSDTFLGQLFLKLLPGYKMYLLSFIMPLTVALAALGAIYGPSVLLAASSWPIINSIRPLSQLLFVVATQQPWSGLSSLALSLLTAWYSFLAMPVLDFVLGNDLQNPTPEEAQHAAHQGLYRNILYFYVPTLYCVLGVVAHLLCTTASVSPLAFIGVSLSAGVGNGILFTVAHELSHGSEWKDKFLANLLLANVFYMHWSKSHLLHHVKVATPEDPASARKNEPLYSFIPRSVWGNIVDAYGSEAERRRKKKIGFWSIQNRALWWISGPTLLTAASYAAYGVKGLCFFLTQALVGIFMLEVVNYIEHYGLTRKKLANGRYERVNPSHSWNASTIYTNSVTFKLQRHSDHHAHDSRPYQILETVQLAPQLPCGYPAMMLLATVPPLFFRVMNPLVEQVESGVALEANQ